jgi:hypothetical protein
MNKVNDNDFIVGGGYYEKNNISISFNYSIDVFFVAGLKIIQVLVCGIRML